MAKKRIGEVRRKASRDQSPVIAISRSRIRRPLQRRGKRESKRRQQEEVEEELVHVFAGHIPFPIPTRHHRPQRLFRFERLNRRHLKSTR